MSVISHGNWSFQDPGDAIPDGSIITGGNYQQLVPDTPILVGKTLMIQGGLWVNVRKDPNWTIEGGNFAQIARCSNLHPEWVGKGLPECPENCSHVTAVDVITIDGVVVDTIYHYADTVV